MEWQRFWFQVTPGHFYAPIPDTRTLKDELWAKPSDLVGVDMNEKWQLEFLSDCAAKYRGEYERFPHNRTGTPHEYYVNNGWFENVDGEILYCMVRRFKPRRIIEVGSGFSTYLSAHAIAKNRQEDPQYGCELTAIEPNPNPVLKAGFPGLTRLISCNVQDVALHEFQKLEANDIFFVDSSHILKIGSDVHYEFLEIIPRLNRGVLIHAHDILLPAEYPREKVFNDSIFWNEQYLLQAFLAFNGCYEVLWASSFMHVKHPDKLEQAFPSYQKSRIGPGSFWMRRIQ